MTIRGTAAGLGGALAAGAALVAGATVWLVVHDPLGAAHAVGEDDLRGLVLAAARLLVQALTRLLRV